MKANRRQSFEMSFMRGRAVTPAVVPSEEKKTVTKAVVPKHRIEPRRHGHDGDGRADISDTPEFDTAALLAPPHSLLGYKPPEAKRPNLKIVILGLSIISSRGNGQADIFRGLARELTARGHDVLFLERDTTHASNHNLPDLPDGHTGFYSSVKDLKQRFNSSVRGADFVIVGSNVEEGVAIGEWVTRAAQGATAFYDLDTPATMANLIRGNAEFISSALIPRYRIYLSSSGGPLLRYIEKHYGSPMVRQLYHSADARLYFPEERALKWDLGYLGNYSMDRQRGLDELLSEPARCWSEGRFVVAGQQYPRSIHWPHNVERLARVAHGKRRAFYNSQRFWLNVSRANTIAAGFSPSARLFEAAACGTPIISDYWQGIETFFKPDDEILISHSADETLIYLEEISELDRRRIGYRARERVLAKHTPRHRAVELEGYALEVLKLSAA